MNRKLIIESLWLQRPSSIRGILDHTQDTLFPGKPAEPKKEHQMCDLCRAHLRQFPRLYVENCLGNIEGRPSRCSLLLLRTCHRRKTRSSTVTRLMAPLRTSSTIYGRSVSEAVVELLVGCVGVRRSRGDLTLVQPTEALVGH